MAGYSGGSCSQELLIKKHKRWPASPEVTWHSFQGADPLRSRCTSRTGSHSFGRWTGLERQPRGLRAWPWPLRTGGRPPISASWCRCRCCRRWNANVVKRMRWLDLNIFGWRRWKPTWVRSRLFVLKLCLCLLPFNSPSFVLVLRTVGFFLSVGSRWNQLPTY